MFMLYLIEDRDYLKIGYSANIDSRIKTYKTHNPHAILLSSKDGNRTDEKNLHALCKEYQYDSEWFYNKDEVKKIFEDYVTTAWDNWKTITCGLNQMMLKFKDILDTNEFWDDLNYKAYKWDCEFKDVCTNLFKNVKDMKKPDNYDYFYGIFKSLDSLMTDFWSRPKLTPLDLINVLLKYQFLVKEEYDFYFEKHKQWRINRIKNELKNVNEQIDSCEKVLNKYKEIKYELEELLKQ